MLLPFGVAGGLLTIGETGLVVITTGPPETPTVMAQPVKPFENEPFTIAWADAICEEAIRKAIPTSVKFFIRTRILSSKSQLIKRNFTSF